MAHASPIPGDRHARALFLRRWCVPILARLHADGGCKFVTLTHTLKAQPTAVRDALDHLISIGLVRRNSGYGHPLRPEYLMTRKGEALAPAAANLDERLIALDLRELGLRRWTLPVLGAVGALQPARFVALSTALGDITPRALSLSLRDLGGAHLLTREVVDEHPPRTEYVLRPRGLALARAYEAFNFG